MRNTAWFDGLKWAEEQFKLLPSAAAEWKVNAMTAGKAEPFDAGARDYVRHHSRHLRGETTLQAS